MIVSTWYPYELHTHTVHSDGFHSLAEMAMKACELGLSGIALTDHNTMSGLQDKESVERETGLHVIHGLEWTSFYGHMNILGIIDYEDWRSLTPIDLHRSIRNIHQKGGIVGIVHPFRIGDPMCTGCFWEYEVSEWNEIDYIEVWSERFPSIKKSNKRAFALWTEKLNQGYKLTAVSGRDWHESDNKETPISATFLNITDKSINSGMEKEKAALKALTSGAVSVSMGPLLLCSLRNKDKELLYTIGDTIEIMEQNNVFEMIVEIDYKARENKYKLSDQDLQVVITSNKNTITELMMSRNTSQAVCTVNVDEITWLRAELYGLFHGMHTMIGFTNPIYIHHRL